VPIVPIAPRYPERARLRGAEGAVDVRVTVLPTGAAGEARVLGAQDPDLAAAALEAGRAARFRPARRGGAPVASELTVRVRFVLD
jgi:protein TonB